MEGEKSVPWPFASDTLKSYHSLGSPKTSGSKPLKGGLNDFSEVSCITPDTQRLTVVKDLHHVHILFDQLNVLLVLAPLLRFVKLNAFGIQETSWFTVHKCFFSVRSPSKILLFPDSSPKERNAGMENVTQQY